MISRYDDDLPSSQQLAVGVQVLGQANDLLAESGVVMLSSISTSLPLLHARWMRLSTPRHPGKMERSRWQELAGCSAYRRDGNRP